jgi:hypothetical protein
MMFLPTDISAMEYGDRGYASERISCVTLSTTTGLSKYVTDGSESYFSRTYALQLSVKTASASAREFHR